MLDRVTQPLGLRTMRFDADKGFFLNGQHVFLKGAARHQDRPMKGWGDLACDQEEDFAILADMGANAVRLPHYQYDQYAYDLADPPGLRGVDGDSAGQRSLVRRPGRRAQR